jgi:hypothetical protein
MAASRTRKNFVIVNLEVSGQSLFQFDKNRFFFDEGCWFVDLFTFAPPLNDA